MRSFGIKIFCCFILLNISFGYGQQNQQHISDTVPQIINDTLNHFRDTLEVISISDTITSITEGPLTSNDTIQIKQSLVVSDTSIVPLTLDSKEFKPNPTKAVIYSAIFPGLGQVYNKKYWKLPIVYGGFLGFSYAISWNGRYYTDYSNGYKDIMDDDPTTDSWKNFLPYGQDPETVDQEWLKTVLKRRKDFYRRYRDLSIIGTVAMYALSMVDAYVDAQLFDFDMSPDLSFRVEPTIIQKTDYLANSFGIQCSFHF
jgi:hypothetical protein